MTSLRLPPSPVALHRRDDRVARLLAGVVAGTPPPVDGEVEVVPQPEGPVAGVLAFGGHHVVAADVDPAWVHARLPRWDMSAPVGAGFIGALGALLGRSPDNLDLVLWGVGEPGVPQVELRRVEPDAGHPRVARALRYRRDVAVLAAPGGLVVVGRGLAGRWEASFEVDDGHRGRGLGRALARAARRLVPVGEPVFVEVAPGNVASLRAVLAAGGYTPAGAEILFADP